MGIRISESVVICKAYPDLKVPVKLNLSQIVQVITICQDSLESRLYPDQVRIFWFQFVVLEKYGKLKELF